MIAFIALASTLSLVAAQEPVHAIRDLVTGFLMGVEPSIGGNITRCVAESDAGFDELNAAARLLQEGIALQNITLVTEAVMRLQVLPEYGARAAEKCNYPVLAAKIQKFLDDLKANPFAVISRLVFVSNTIVDDLNKFVIYFAAENYLLAGHSLGDALAVLIRSNGVRVKGQFRNRLN